VILEGVIWVVVFPEDGYLKKILYKKEKITKRGERNSRVW